MTDAPLTISVGERVGNVSALLTAPDTMRALYVLAHGAGAGMQHPFLARMAGLLADRGVGTLRYQFPYMEAKRRRPDPPPVAVAAVRAAIAAAAEAVPGVSLIAGGKSFGARMTSTAQAAAPLPGVRGLAFLGFPLHPPGHRGSERAAHLQSVAVPMLFIQGTRDAFADLEHLTPVVRRLGPRATLELVDGGDHSFRLPARAGRTEGSVMAQLADAIMAWLPEGA